MGNVFDRRAFLARSGLLAGGVILGPSFLAACGRSDTATAGAPSTDTLRFGFLADMQVPDPDIFYEGEGLIVTMSVYDNLIKYKEDTSDFEGMLAKSWEVSPDALTYTFALRDDVKFHDGTPFDAAAMISSFERRTAVAQGPAYMLANIASTTAPDPHTLVITLKSPVEPFLDYLACPWGPKPVSPALIKANEAGGDLAQKWLESHDAGTGPFKIVEFVPASHYTLEANADYWGTKPSFKQVRIEIIPDVTTQRLKLENGELDVVTKGLPIADVESFAANPKFKVETRPMAFKVSLYVNATSGIFADKELRQALATALDRKALLEPTYKAWGSVSTDWYPEGYLPKGSVPENPPLDTAKLKGLVGGLSDKAVDLAYDEQGGATDRRLTELIQAQLQALGLDVTVRGMPTSQVFALCTTPAESRPDLLVGVAGGDAPNPDAALRIIWRTDAQPLNWFNYSLPALDALMDEAIAQTTTEAANAKYIEAAEMIMEEGWIINIGDLKQWIITPASVTNVVHDLAALNFVRLNEFKKA